MKDPATTRTTVLLVDDSATDRTRSAGLIRNGRPQWNVITVASAREALTQLAKTPVDIVVSDLVMPDIDGRQLLRIVHHDHPLVPVVLMTAKGNDQIAAECVGLGAANYVPKRMLATDLVNVLTDVLQSEEEMLTMRKVLQHVVQNRCEFQIESNLKQIWSLIRFVRERLFAVGTFSAHRIQSITSAVGESLLNAHFHGNLQVNERPLQLPRAEYVALAEQRKQAAEFSSRHIRLTMTLQLDRIRFHVADDGPGFDQSCLEELTGPPSDELHNGNGIRQMRTAMRDVSYNECGNEVVLTDAADNTALAAC